MVSRPKRKRGGQAQYVTGRDGKPIVGLSCNSSDSRFYATHSRPRKWFGSDFDHALIRFHEWDAKQAKRTVKGKDWSNHPDGAPREPYEKDGMTVIPVPKSVEIPEDIFWSMFRAKMQESPTKCAEASGYPLDRLHDFKAPKPSPTLQSLIDLFEEKGKVSVDWKRKIKRFWTEFTKTVTVKTVREITQQDIADYHDEIIGAKYSSTYKGHRFGAVKRIFSFARMRGIAPDEMRTVLDYLAILQSPKSNSNDPHPIAVADFHALLNKASDKWSAMMIAALNCCMYGIEVSRIEKSEINFRKKTLVTSREKTGVTRVSVLWDRTIEAIKQLPETEHTHIFLSREGNPFASEGMRTAFRKLRERANIDESVKFSDIRDGAYTAAIEGGADLTHAKILAGHETGISDHYVKRNPKMVADACKTIEKHYFGGKEK